MPIEFLGRFWIYIQRYCALYLPIKSNNYGHGLEERQYYLNFLSWKIEFEDNILLSIGYFNFIFSELLGYIFILNYQMFINEGLLVYMNNGIGYYCYCCGCCFYFIFFFFEKGIGYYCCYYGYVLSRPSLLCPPSWASTLKKRKEKKNRRGDSYLAPWQLTLD